MPTSIKFGDIFRYDDKEYIFLANTSEVTYAAQILTETETTQVTALHAKRATTATKDHILFCYVILQTQEFIGRAASFVPTQNGLQPIYDITGIKLGIDDLRSIRQEIMDANVIPRGLKSLVKDIEP